MGRGPWETRWSIEPVRKDQDNREGKVGALESKVPSNSESGQVNLVLGHLGRQLMARQRCCPLSKMSISPKDNTKII